MVLLVLIIVVQVRVFNQPLAPVVVGLVLLHRAMGQLVLVQGHWQLMMQEVGSLEIVEEEMARLASNQEATGTTTLEPLARGIRFDRVTFGYGDAKDGTSLKTLRSPFRPIGPLPLLASQGPERRRSPIF